MTSRKNAQGFLVFAGVFVLVVLSALAAYLLTVSTTSQTASLADFNSARAFQAARAGTEWAAFQLLRNPGNAFKTGCDAGPATATTNLTFGSTLSTFTATVTCARITVLEGAASVKTYRVVSTACNLPSPGCPNAATPTVTYVERELAVSLTE